MKWLNHNMQQLILSPKQRTGFFKASPGSGNFQQPLLTADAQTINNHYTFLLPLVFYCLRQPLAGLPLR